MTRKKGKFLTFCCSLIPGAGEMYLGFLKQGVSIMTIFFLLFGLGSVLFPPLIVFCAVVWFYSFFHTHNLNSLPEDEFYAIQDDYLLGLSMIWSNIYSFFIYLARDVLNISLEFLTILSWISQAIPRTVAALLIIALGICLIRNKKQELES